MLRKLYSKPLSICFNDYSNTTNEEKEKMGEKFSPNNLLMEGFKLICSKKKPDEKRKPQPEKSIAETVNFC